MQMDGRRDDIGVGRGAGSVRPPGRRTAALSHRRGSGGSWGRGRDRPQVLEFSDAVMTVLVEADTSTRFASLDRRELSSSQVQTKRQHDPHRLAPPPAAPATTPPSLRQVYI